jgi:GNAT superfamily N-acetyltransferase
VLPRLDGGGLVLIAARVDGRLAGSVQLDCDTPPNQPHRADIKKLLVHPDFRRRGLGKRLLAAAEDEARRHGRNLLTLDTRTGDRGEPLYLSVGYKVIGIVPGYAMNIHSTGYDDCTFMYKQLA